MKPQKKKKKKKKRSRSRRRRRKRTLKMAAPKNIPKDAQSTVDADDIKLAIQCRMDQSFTSPPPRDFLLEVARQKNLTPLPLIKPYTGPRLPPDRYCLTAPNYRLKTVQKKKVMTPVTLSGQRFTVQIPPPRPPSRPPPDQQQLAGGGVDSLKRKHEDDDDYDAL
ncbi:hypothetical protein F7725_006420 [Dissostichus mawsoni]|uniref:Uncharacterized protein n=1 Tax=Dissostichus mawsoni TaxID=36200 RepID=A0A7J5XWQ6_DISMA|nr:hypothetical protein F7725_006420 [Dissostichus mawsoni]